MKKLTNEDKINIYIDRKNRIPLSTISMKYHTTPDNVQYLYRLISKHGTEILYKKNRYDIQRKKQIINRVLSGETIISVAIDEGLRSKSMLSHWVSNYIKNGYNIVEQKRGRSPTIMKKSIRKDKKETLEEENERLKRENLYLKAKLEYSKKLRAVVQARKNQQQKKE